MDDCTPPARVLRPQSGSDFPEGGVLPQVPEDRQRLRLLRRLAAGRGKRACGGTPPAGRPPSQGDRSLARSSPPADEAVVVGASLEGLDLREAGSAEMVVDTRVGPGGVRRGAYFGPSARKATEAVTPACPICLGLLALAELDGTATAAMGALPQGGPCGGAHDIILQG